MNNAHPAVLGIGKWVGAAIFIVVVCAVIYIGAVISVYLLAWIIELIGTIF